MRVCRVDTASPGGQTGPGQGQWELRRPLQEPFGGPSVCIPLGGSAFSVRDWGYHPDTTALTGTPGGRHCDPPILQRSKLRLVYRASGIYSSHEAEKTRIQVCLTAEL